jgi:hypothetical protein
MNLSAIAVVVAATLATAPQTPVAPVDLAGRVLYSDLPVPGATITGTQGPRTASTVSDADGTFRLGALDDGTWTVRVEMRGFVTATRDVTLPLTDPLTFTLTMRSYRQIVGSTAPSPETSAPEQAPTPNIEDLLAADVINGTVTNGAATPFAQPRAAGNNRPGLGARYTGGITAVFGNSAWNAHPFSFARSSLPAPAYGDTQLGFTLGGALRIPWLVKNGPQMLLGYQHGVLHTATTQSALMPTRAQRAGDLSQSSGAIRDPATGLPFPGGVIAPERISPQATALLAYYPLPNAATAPGANYQTATLSATTQDNVQFATSKAVTRKTALNGTFSFQRAATDAVDLFDFSDANRQSTLTGTAGWTRRFTTRLSARLRYQFTRAAASLTPFFANRVNVSGDAGINGNSQDPADWGPPTLSFPNIAGLRDGDYQHSTGITHAAGGDLLFKRGRHDVTIGGDVRRNAVDTIYQRDPRGTLAFTGAASGDAFADFLLGIPATSAIAFGNADTRLRQYTADAYANDDWRLSGLTLNLGVRWEYEGPFAEAAGRVAGGLLPDRHGLEPRLGASWRPVPASSLVIRASYGLYRNLGVYQPLALLLTQQPPYSRTFSVQNGASTALTLANPFPPSVPSATTFAVEPSFRPGSVQNWQASVQRDLPASLTATAAYIGAEGSDLMQASLPNTYPAGAVNPCPDCPSGFVFATSNGRSLRNALQLTLRRRLHNGVTASVQYTLAKSTDDAATFSNTAVAPKTLAVAQDWLNLAAERAPSSFDQRHLLTATAQYTSGVGVTGGTLVDTGWGRLFKDWTMAAQLSTGSGFPLTPVFFAAVPGTGYVGVRPRLTGVSPDPMVSGSYANAGAYAAPLPGTWGDAARNSIRGPAPFSLDASLARVFRVSGRVNAEWRVAAANLLNRVTFSTIETVVTNPQFGRPTLANPMRTLRMTLRLRF